MSEDDDKRRRMDAAWPWIIPDERDPETCYRDGWAIIIPDPKSGGHLFWGEMTFPTMDGANMTAARVVSGPCDIQPVREVRHRTKWKKSYRIERTIILKDGEVPDAEN